MKRSEELKRIIQERENGKMNYKEIHKLAVFLVDDSFKANDKYCKKWITMLQDEIYKLR